MRTPKPDYLLHVDLFNPKERIRAVPCKVFLNLAAGHRSRVILRPDGGLGERLVAAGPWAIIGYPTAGAGPMPGMYIRMPRFHVSSATTTDWGPALSEMTAHGHSSAIIISSRLNGNVGRRTAVVAHLYGAGVVSPREIETRSFTGITNFEPIWRCRVRVGPKQLVIFERHTVYPKRGPRSGIRAPVLTTDLPAPLGGPEITLRRYRDDLEDLLTLVSIAGRARTSWHRIEASDGRHFVKYFDTARRPPAAPNHGLEPLVERPHIREFLESGFSCLRRSPARLELIGASLALAPYFRVPLESAFLGMFANLESLVIALGPGPSGVAILPPGRWHSLRRSLFRALQSGTDIGGPLTPLEIAAIYRKFPELNRQSFADAWQGHIASRSIPVSDLWPMATRDGLLDLLKIRNKLAHGEIVPKGAAIGLSNALFSLRWLLERVVLGAVGFDLAKTDASPTRLFGRNLHPVIHLAQHRKGITEAWVR